MEPRISYGQVNEVLYNARQRMDGDRDPVEVIDWQGCREMEL